MGAPIRWWLLSAVLLLLSAPSRPALLAQSSDATIPVAGAETFLGNWTVNANGDTGPVTVRVALTDNGGRMAARITGGAEGVEGRVIQRIARSQDGGLAISYSLTMQGQAVPTVLTLRPDGAAMRATIDLAGGQLVLRGDAKKEP